MNVNGIQILESDRCVQCGLYKAETKTGCPSCGGTMEMKIEGLCLSWNCAVCGYGLATTAQKLCVVDNGRYAPECYGKCRECPYSEISGREI